MSLMTKPSEEYYALIEEYKHMHKDPTMFPGKSMSKYINYIKSMIKDNKCKSLLDYGCGKAVLYEEDQKFTKDITSKPIHKFWNIKELTCYDPGVEKFSKIPEGTHDIVLAVDVMEHLPSQDLEWIIDNIMGYADKVVFLNIACYEALKTFSNGDNLHITVHDPDWWIELLDKIWYDKHRKRINVHAAFEEVESRFVSTGIYKTHVLYKN